MTDQLRTARQQLAASYRRLADEATKAAAHYADPHSGDPADVLHRVDGRVQSVHHAHRLQRRGAHRRLPAATKEGRMTTTTSPPPGDVVVLGATFTDAERHAADHDLVGAVLLRVPDGPSAAAGRKVTGLVASVEARAHPEFEATHRPLLYALARTHAEHAGPVAAIAAVLAVEFNQPEADWIDQSMARVVHGGLAAAGYVVVRDDPRHLLELTDTGWTLQHSLTCRLDGTLFDCPTNRAVSDWMDLGDPGQRGWYVVDLDDDGDVVLGDQVHSPAPVGAQQ